jgi:putative transposase
MHPGNRRKLLKRREIVGHSRYLTFSCCHRLPLLQNDRIKQAFVDCLIRARQLHHFQLAAWIVMPEHVHLLLRPNLPDSPVPLVLNAIKSSLAHQVLARWREVKAPILARITDRGGAVRFWQAGGGYDRNIESYEETWEKMRYIHNNPVVRGLVAAPTDWPWSSARWYEGDRSGPVWIDPIDEFW